MIYNIFVWKYFLFQFQQHIKLWAKPATLSLISGVVSDLTRRRFDLIVENAMLRNNSRPPSPGETTYAHPRLSLGGYITANLG